MTFKWSLRSDHCCLPSEGYIKFFSLEKCVYIRHSEIQTKLEFGVWLHNILKMFYKVTNYHTFISIHVYYIHVYIFKIFFIININSHTLCWCKCLLQCLICKQTWFGYIGCVVLKNVTHNHWHCNGWIYYSENETSGT